MNNYDAMRYLLAIYYKTTYTINLVFVLVANKVSL